MEEGDAISTQRDRRKGRDGVGEGRWSCSPASAGPGPVRAIPQRDGTDRLALEAAAAIIGREAVAPGRRSVPTHRTSPSALSPQNAPERRTRTEMKRRTEERENLSGIEMDGALWNDPLTRRTFLKNTGVSSAAVIAGTQGLRAATGSGGETSSGGLIKVVAVSPNWQPYNSGMTDLNGWGFVGIVVFSGPTERLHIIVRDMTSTPYQASVLLGAGRPEWKGEIDVEGRREQLSWADGALQWLPKETKILRIRFSVSLNAKGEIIGAERGSEYEGMTDDLTVGARQNWNGETNTMLVQGSAFWKPSGDLAGAEFSYGKLSGNLKFGGGAAKSVGPVTITYTFAKV